MELKFIWVDSFRVIKKLGFNFGHSGKHKFSFKNDVLELLDNPKGVINFGPNVSGVTFVAGQNGSGKSSLCEICLLSTATLVPGLFGYEIPFEGIVCYGDHIFYQEKINLNNIQELKRNKYKLVPFKNSPFESMDYNWRDSFQRGGFIYYSNILDYRSAISTVNLANISTQFLITEDFKFSTSFYPPNNKKESYLAGDFHDLITIYHRNQGSRFAKFYVNHPDFIPFGKPKYFEIKAAYSGNNRWLDRNKVEGRNGLLAFRGLENEILSGLTPYYDNKNFELALTLSSTRAKIVLIQLYKFNLIVSLGILNNKLPNIEDAYNYIFKNSATFDDQLDHNSISKLVTLYERIVSKSQLGVSKYYPVSMESHLYKNSENWRFYLIESIFLNNSKGNLQLLKEFIDTEELVLRKDRTIRMISNFSLGPDLSAGETSFMNFFSRLYDIVKRFDLGYDKRKSLILFIDEGEVGFHPEWKRLYFKWVLEFLNQIECSYKFQLIFTTHSPYLLSDVPSENVLLLCKSEKGLTEIKEASIFKTFGANIHELLANSFFLQNGFIGEFAKLKIEQLIDYLKFKNNSFDRNSSLALIECVGDPIISSRLLDLYYDRFPVSTNTKTEVEYVEWLNSELERVKNFTNND